MVNETLRLLSSMATRELLGELASQFTARTGTAVNAQAAGGVDVAKRVQADEPVDVVVLASNAIDKLIAAGKVLPARVDVARSGIALAVRAGAARPDIASEEAVKAAVLAAGSLSYSTGPSGVYLETLFARWGILEKIRPRIVIPPPGVPVGSLVAGGKAELGFQQLSELTGVAGITLLGSLPAAIQSITVFSGGVATASGPERLAHTLLEFLGSADAADSKRRNGMEPA